MKIKSNQNSGFGKVPKQELEVEKIFKLLTVDLQLAPFKILFSHYFKRT